MSTSHSNSLDNLVTIERIFDEFRNKIVQVQLYQRDANEMANKKLSQLSDYAEFLKEKPELEDDFFDGNNMFFYNAEDGKRMQFGHITRNLEDIKKAVVLHENRQYQLFLAEAYEAFEDFIEDAYAYAGYIDKNLWPCNDFGNVSLAEINENSFDFEFFRKKLNNKKDKPRSILNQLIKSFPELLSLEKENKLNINLRLVITLIEKIRHIAVHNGGKVSDQQDFIDKIFKDSGLQNIGDFGKKHSEFIQSFFRDGYPNTLIILLKLDLLPGGNSAYRTIFEDISGYLVTYAYMLFNCLEAHQKRNISDN